MKYSVIVPFFNPKKRIRKTIKSVDKQTHDSIELILVNDGSSDSAANIVSEAVKHIQIPSKIVDRENGGPGAARNTGIKHAQGEYVCFLDADDFWFKNKISRIDTRIKKGNDLICHDLLKIDHKGNCVGRLKCGPYNTYRTLLFNGNCIYTSGTVIKRSIIEDVGYFNISDELMGVEDYDLWLRLFNEGYKFSYLNEPLGGYEFQGGISSNLPTQYLRGTRLAHRHFSKLDKEPTDWGRYSIRFIKHSGLYFLKALDII